MKVQLFRSAYKTTRRANFLRLCLLHASYHCLWFLSSAVVQGFSKAATDIECATFPKWRTVNAATYLGVLVPKSWQTYVKIGSHTWGYSRSESCMLWLHSGRAKLLGQTRCTSIHFGSGISILAALSMFGHPLAAFLLLAIKQRFRMTFASSSGISRLWVCTGTRRMFMKTES